MIRYKKSIFYHAIYIKVLSDGTMSYLVVSTGDVLNTTNNEKNIPELRKISQDYFEIKVQ